MKSELLDIDSGLVYFITTRACERSMSGVYSMLYKPTDDLKQLKLFVTKV